MLASGQPHSLDRERAGMHWGQAMLPSEGVPAVQVNVTLQGPAHLTANCNSRQQPFQLDLTGSTLTFLVSLGPPKSRYSIQSVQGCSIGSSSCRSQAVCPAASGKRCWPFSLAAQMLAVHEAPLEFAADCIQTCCWYLLHSKML